MFTGLRDVAERELAAQRVVRQALDAHALARRLGRGEEKNPNVDPTAHSSTRVLGNSEFLEAGRRRAAETRGLSLSLSLSGSS